MGLWERGLLILAGLLWLMAGAMAYMMVAGY